MIFSDRVEAGRALASVFETRPELTNPLVLALPRGGVPVAFEIATRLHAPLDVFIVRKLGVPGYREFAMGAMASGGVCVINRATTERLNISDQQIDAVVDRERAEMERRELEYRGDRPPAVVEGRTVIVVDDGLATGSTMAAAVEALRKARAGRVIVAVPVGSPEAVVMLRHMADEVVCLSTPQNFRAVGLWYRDFSETSDQEVRMLLSAAAGELIAQSEARS